MSSEGPTPAAVGRSRGLVDAYLPGDGPARPVVEALSEPSLPELCGDDLVVAYAARYHVDEPMARVLAAAHLRLYGVGLAELLQVQRYEVLRLAAALRRECECSE